MGSSIVRSVLAVLGALIVAFVLVIAVEGFSVVVHPFPADFDGSFEQMVEHVARYPGWVLIMAALMWAGTVFISAWLATRYGTGRHKAHGIAVGALLMLAVVYNMLMLPYPLWFEIANLLMFPLATYYGTVYGTVYGANSRAGQESR